MTQWSRVLLPVGLGVAAFFLNAWTMSRAVTPHYFVALNTDLEAGEVIEPGMMVPFELCGQYDRLQTVLIPYSQRSLLTGAHFRRPVNTGDLVFEQDVVFGETNTSSDEVQITIPVRSGTFEADLIDPDDAVSFVFRSHESDGTETVGPFRVVAIGSRTTAFSAGQRYGRAQSLTVAVARQSPSRSQLEQALDRSSVQSVVFSKFDL